MNEVTIKQCTKCRVEKPVSEFNKDRGAKDGLYCQCRSCSKKAARSFRERNPEKLKASKQQEYQAHKEHYQEYHRKYYKQNKQTVQEQHRQYYARTKEKASARSKRYYATHREELLPRFQRYYATHREEQRTYHRAYYQANKYHLCLKIEEARRRRVAADPDYENTRRRQYYVKIRNKHLARVRSWRMRNKHKVHIYSATRRARKQAAGGGFTAAQWQALCQWFGNMCLACGVSDKLTIDHVIPLSRGGAHCINNVQPLCQVCNSSKGTKTTDYRDRSRLKQFLQE